MVIVLPSQPTHGVLAIEFAEMASSETDETRLSRGDYRRSDVEVTVTATIGNTMADQDTGDCLVLRMEIRDYLIDTVEVSQRRFQQSGSFRQSLKWLSAATSIFSRQRRVGPLSLMESKPGSSVIARPQASRPRA